MDSRYARKNSLNTVGFFGRRMPRRRSNVGGYGHICQGFAFATRSRGAAGCDGESAARYQRPRRSCAPQAERAHPSDEHFLPLLTAMGAREDRDRLRILPGGMTYGVLSMDSFVWDH